MKNKYNRTRELENIKKNIRSDRSYKREMAKIYHRAESQIIDRVNLFIANYADKNGLDVMEVNKIINTFDVRAFQEQARVYVETKNFTEKANKELAKYNLTMKVSRLDLLKRQIILELIDLANSEEIKIREHISEELDKELERQAGILGMTVEQRSKIRMKALVLMNSSFHSTSFSDRIWDRHRMLGGEINERLTYHLERSIFEGKNPKTWYKDMRQFLRDDVRNSIQKAEKASFRLATTETARVQMEVARQSLEEGGFKHYEWVAEPTACEICSPLNGRVFALKEATIGSTLPPMHPYCRCSIIGKEK